MICTIDSERRFVAELEIKVGRGYVSGEDNKQPDQPIGVIAIDSLYSPVTLVKYSVENTRVGQMTDFDKLILEIWTDGRITPDDCLKHAAAMSALCVRIGPQSCLGSALGVGAGAPVGVGVAATA